MARDLNRRIAEALEPEPEVPWGEWIAYSPLRLWIRVVSNPVEPAQFDEDSNSADALIAVLLDRGFSCEEEHFKSGAHQAIFEKRGVGRFVGEEVTRPLAVAKGGEAAARALGLEEGDGR